MALAFGRSARTLRRNQQRFEDQGLAALGSAGGYPKGRWRMSNARTQLIHRLKAGGRSNREIARQLGVSEMAIRKVLRRLGWKAAGPTQTELSLEKEVPANPNLSAFSSGKADVPLSQGCDPAHRGADRLLARLGLLECAAAR